MSRALRRQAVLFLIASAGVLALTSCGGGNGSASVSTGPLVDYATCTDDVGREDVAAFRATAHHPGMAEKRHGKYPTIKEAFEATITLCAMHPHPGKESAYGSCIERYEHPDIVCGPDPEIKAAAIESKQEERCTEWKNDHHAVTKALTALPLADIFQRLVEYRVLCDEGLIR